MKEANRQLQYNKQYEKNIGNIEFMKGENEAGAGRFLSSSALKLRIGDGKIIHQNIEKIDTMSESCEKLRQQIEEHHNTLVKGMFLIKPYKTVQRDFDLEFIDKMVILKKEMDEMNAELANSNEKYSAIFVFKRKVGRTVEGIEIKKKNCQKENQ